MELLQVSKLNEVYNKIECDPGIAYELREYFSFRVPGYQFVPAYKNKFWDGFIRLYNPLSGVLYGGLLYKLKDFCKEREYQLDLTDNFLDNEFSVKEAHDFIDNLDIPEEYERRDYQVEALVHAIRHNRTLFLSATASGKSLLIYFLIRYYNLKTLVIVPTISLVSQMTSDFKDYGFDSDRYIHQIYGGQEKETDKPIVVSTWQSLQKQPKSYFDQYDVVFGDEAHLFAAKVLTSIMEKLVDTKYRFGFTGTLSGSKTHQLVLEGLFGQVKNVITSAELINQGYAAKFFIKAIILKYSEQKIHQIKKASYQEELDFIIRDTDRNRFIKNLALSLKGNTIVLFNFVDKHGKILYHMLQSEAKDRKVFFVAGEVSVEEREKIRRAVEDEENAIIVASKVFQTGVNIKNLHNLIFTSPNKARIKTLQSIGRGLRKSSTKLECTLFDIADDLIFKKKNNYTLDHFIERIKIYAEEKFPYKLYNVKLKDLNEEA